MVYTLLATSSTNTSIALCLLLGGPWLAILSPPAKVKHAATSLALSLLGIAFGLGASWLGSVTLSARTLLELLQIKLETLCTVFHFQILGALWLLVTLLSLALVRHGAYLPNLEDPQAVRIRRFLLTSITAFLGLHVYLLSQAQLGPIECPPELQFENLRNIDQVTFNDPRVEKMMPKKVLPDSILVNSLCLDDREHLYRVVTRHLNDENYEFAAPELYLVYVLVDQLDQCVPATEASTEFSVAMLSFARRHQREFLWGPELRYFWNHGLAYLAAESLLLEERQRWRLYSKSLRLKEETEICSARYFVDWTCASSRLTLFGKTYRTSLPHLLRDIRVRWACLILNIPSKEEQIREDNAEESALAALRELKHRRTLSTHREGMYWDERSQTLQLWNEGPPIFRGSQKIHLKNLGSPPKIPKSSQEMPRSLCRCEREPAGR